MIKRELPTAEASEAEEFSTLKKAARYVYCMRFEELRLPEMREILFLLVGLAIGAAIILGGSELEGKEGDTSRVLVEFLENQSGQDLEVISSEEIGKLYRIDIRNPQDRLVTYYASQDGNMFSSDFRTQEEVRNRNQAFAEFRGCLNRSGTVIIGNRSQEATLRQIQIMGGSQIAGPIYRDVSNTTVLRQAVQQGVQRTPALLSGGDLVQGVQTLQEVESFTGCQFNIS